MARWVCIASGESLDQEDIDLCRGKVSVACVSNAAQLALWADVMLAADHTWWLQYGDSVADFQGIKYCTGGEVEGVTHLDSKFNAQIGSGLIARGGSSGQATISAIIEYHGAGDIALIGYDNKGTHFFGEHATLGNPTPKNFEVWAESHAKFNEDAKANGIRITNCSRETTLTCYPRMSLVEWLT